MIGTRKAHAALAQGEVQFLEVENRAILAFLRSDGGETILAVHNLSAERAEIALDLAGYAGVEPVDLLDEERLAPVGEALYRIGLGRYGYRWLRLGRGAVYRNFFKIRGVGIWNLDSRLRGSDEGRRKWDSRDMRGMT